MCEAAGKESELPIRGILRTERKLVEAMEPNSLHRSIPHSKPETDSNAEAWENSKGLMAFF